jgi:hypothetical protein
VITARRCRHDPLHFARHLHTILKFFRETWQRHARSPPERFTLAVPSPYTPLSHTLRAAAFELSKSAIFQCTCTVHANVLPLRRIIRRIQEREWQTNTIHQFPLSPHPLPCLHVASSEGRPLGGPHSTPFEPCWYQTRRRKREGERPANDKNKHFPHHPMTRSPPIPTRWVHRDGPQLDTVSYCVFVSAYLFLCYIKRVSSRETRQPRPFVTHAWLRCC